ncbi:MAG TPA: hypothetical protein VFQ22_07890, partial [Longimicrobiales bacterium]|nr:hypothetical protein [Longimicrobiales bacterium]
DARAREIDAVLDRVEAGDASASEVRALADALERDAAEVRAGRLGGDAERLTALAGVLRRLEV